MSSMIIDASQSVCLATLGQRRSFSFIPGDLANSKSCLLVENNGLANICLAAARPGSTPGGEIVKIIGQPVPLGLAGFHHSVLQSGT